MPFTELDGYPKYRWDEDRGWVLETVYPVAWADRLAAVPVTREGLSLASKRVVGVGRLGGEADGDDTWATYELAHVMATYSAGGGGGGGGGGMDPDWSFEKSWAMDVIQVGGVSWGRASGADPHEYIDEGAPILVPMTEWTVTKYKATLEQWAVVKAAVAVCMGCINHAEYQGAPLGHVLFVGPGLRGAADDGEIKRVDYTLKFLERPHDWRKRFHATDETAHGGRGVGWHWVLTGDELQPVEEDPPAPGESNYEVADLSTLGVPTIP